MASKLRPLLAIAGIKDLSLTIDRENEAAVFHFRYQGEQTSKTVTFAEIEQELSDPSTAEHQVFPQQPPGTPS